MDEYQKGVKLGLRAAASYLDSEAEDLLDKRKGQSVLMTVEDLAKLITEYAQQVRELTVTPGR